MQELKKSIIIAKEGSISLLVRKYVYYAKFFLLSSFWIKKIKNVGRGMSHGELFNISNKEIMRPIQSRYEVLELMKILEETKPRTILEIGTDRGGSLFLFSKVVPEDAHIISISFGYCPSWRKKLFASFMAENQRFDFIEGDSHSKETLEKLKAALKGEKLDFLFIDADHSYEAAKMDFEMYGPLVNEDGLIGFHDIVFSPEFGVKRLWNEIKCKYEHVEIMDNRNQVTFGIGLISNKPFGGLLHKREAKSAAIKSKIDLK